MGAKCCAGGTTDDAKKFYAASEKNDIKSFIRLLSSTQPIAEFDGILPWADPKTVGALAATQLAIMSRNASDALNTSNSTKVNDDIRKAATKVNDDIRKAGAIPPLVIRKAATKVNDDIRKAAQAILAWRDTAHRDPVLRSNAMGAKCCANRKDNKPAPPKKPNDKDKKQRSIKPGARERNLSIGGTTDDAKKFDAAFEKNDIKSFVRLLSSTQPIAEFEEPLHPWAEDPKTVGT
eukprot:CAMPEP_0172929430 /NCGR_PEP_ID=MMETSP1075-20121228/218478_1 /TAXON_ID=2916 /ORGANISM="Ceratium fusus, Strain PA161109" /LENGTH=234 /DNA_ID=CAMNT_0013790725 /DNA_START=67 /DNA_END=769 /DNA_ORIENTATION=-